MVVGDALEAILESWLTEIHQQSKRHFKQSKIGQDLLGMNQPNFFGRLQFNQKAVFDNQISFERVIYDNAFEFDRNRNLLSYRKATLAQTCQH